MEVKNLINAILQEKSFFREVNSDISIIICFMSKFYAIIIPAQSKVIFWRLICWRLTAFYDHWSASRLRKGFFRRLNEKMKVQMNSQWLKVTNRVKNLRLMIN